ALATISTHDLPTLEGFVLEADLRARDALKLFPTPQIREAQYEMRRLDRARLPAALREAHLRDGDGVGVGDAAPVLQVDDAFVQAVHAYVARTPSQLMTFQ